MQDRDGSGNGNTRLGRGVPCSRSRGRVSQRGCVKDEGFDHNFSYCPFG